MRLHLCVILGHWYRKLYPGFATNITVTTGNSSLENRGAMYTAYSNLNVWFDTLKEFLITKAFARERLDGENGEGELVFFPGQLNRILNLDESGLTLDGNQSKSGGRSSTRYSSQTQQFHRVLIEQTRSALASHLLVEAPLRVIICHLIFSLSL